MSYRTFKRVLGESSLERKCLFLFGTCLLLLITGSFLLYGWRTENVVTSKAEKTKDLLDRQNRIMGRLLVDAIMLHYHWEKLETKQKPEEQEPEDRMRVQAMIEELSKQHYQWWYFKPDDNENSAKGPHDLKELDEQELKWLAKFSKPLPAKKPSESAPTSQSTAKTGAQKQALPEKFAASEFEDRRKNIVVRQVIDGKETVVDKEVYQYYQPIRAKKKGACITCHNARRGEVGFGATGIGRFREEKLLTEGDLMAVVKVQIDDRDTQEARLLIDEKMQSELTWNNALLLTTALVTVVLAMIALYVIVRYVIVKPLQHLRDVSDKISHGDINVRAEIQTGDEFEELGVAFNRMLRHLIDAQQELHKANEDLDRKVDEQAQLNMQLYEMNRLKSDFLATMSHELRTPLNSIIGFSDVLDSADGLDEKQKHYARNIKTSGNMLLEMINDILDLAKIESGKIELRLTHFHIDQVVSAQCDMARPLTDKKNIDLEIDVESDLPELYLDQVKVQQIINNLLSNAIKFTPEGGRIVVSTRKSPQGNLMLIVSDTGVGISQEDQTTIFEKFRQGTTVLATGDAMTREYSGTGLGLSIVKELCKLLGGEITVQSDLGKGSTFTVWLPWERAEEPKRDSPLADQLEQLTKPRRIDFQRNVDMPVPSSTQAAE